MLKKIIIGTSLVIAAVLIGLAVFILRPTAEASAPIEAIPLEKNTPEEVTGESGTGDMSQSDQRVVFSIVPESSTVRFTLDEILRGEPTSVVGTSSQVSGEIAIDFNQPANSEIGVILVNARTLVTDKDFRNRAINNSILETGKYEFITFTPTEITAFPENPGFGEELTFQITGDLTIREITHPVTFTARVTADSQTELKGYASAIISRADYNLIIPSVSSVADVDEEVLLEIDFLTAVK